MEQQKLRSAQKTGTVVTAALIALAVLEYILALAMDSGNLPWMLIMNVVDAALILYFFMHIAHLWRGGEE